ncbi:hypothetical protein CRENBAI_016779 [Crenichthys baileyi]|uniref:Uncharacterized protein n=1 Tax=Crenichthys baileyi TaxID=28760 RepID=A0AAV9SII1_9TELE
MEDTALLLSFEWFSPNLVSQTDLLASQAPTSSSTLVIPQSSMLHSSRPWILSRVSYLLLLSFSGSSPPILPHQHFLFSLRQRSTRSLAPPTDIHHGNARPGSSLRAPLQILQGQLINLVSLVRATAPCWRSDASELLRSIGTPETVTHSI